MKAAQSSAAPELTGEYHGWQAAGKCLEYHPDFFFDHAEQNPDIAAIAKDVCSSCPVKQTCLSQAMLTNERFGIWGGMDPEERVKHRRVWQRDNGGLMAVRGMRERSGIGVVDPSIDRRYSARLKAAQECRSRVLDAGPFHRREEFLSVLEMIISHPTEDSGKLGRRIGCSKAWFNTVKREVYRMFDVHEVYEAEEEIA